MPVVAAGSDSGRDGDCNEAGEQRRRLDYRWTADAMLEIRALLPAEEGALVLAALRRAGDHLFRHSTHQAADDRTDPAGDAGGDVADDVPAGTPEPTGGDGDADWSDSLAASLDMAGDAWDEAAAPYEAPPEGWEYDFIPAAHDVSARTPDADADVDVERDSADEWRARQADALVAMADTVVADGLRPGSGPSRYHRRQRVRASAHRARRLSRAVKLRDDGCVFPGAHGAATPTCTTAPTAAPTACSTWPAYAEPTIAWSTTTATESPARPTEPSSSTDPTARPSPNPPLTVPAGDETLRRANTKAGVNPGEESQTPDWDGTRPNYAMIIEHLLYVAGRLHLVT